AVVDAVTVIIGVRAVADPVTVGVHPLTRVQRERIIAVVDAVVVVVGVAGVTRTVLVEVALTRVRRRRAVVRAVHDAVAIVVRQDREAALDRSRRGPAFT